MSSSKYDIVIVGGNMGGVAVAHYLLKNTIPALRKLDASKGYHVTIISPSTHYFWKVSAPRVMAKGDDHLYEQILRPLDKGFAQYGADVEFVRGVAISTDAASRIVKVKKTDSTEETVHYDSLVIATGTTSADPLWSLHDDHAKTLEAFKNTKEALSKAKVVLIAGGGAVGVESAGEIRAAFPQTKITILSGADRLLVRAAEGMSKSAEQTLENQNIEVIHKVKTESSEKTAEGQTKIKLSDGSERIVDVYINGTGGTPNSSWIPDNWLNEQKRVKVDKESLRATGSDCERVYAIGDIADYSNQTWMDTDFAVGPISTSIGADIVKTLNNGKGASRGLIGGLLGFIPGFGSVLTPKAFKPLKGVFLVPIGPSTGVATLMGFTAPGFLVSVIKGRTYFLELALKEWSGSSR